MKTLALEFSSIERSVALLDQDQLLGTITRKGDLPTNAFEMIEAVLAAAKIEREHIECLAVGLGPGSYTGVRSAIALAQGWQLARPVKLLGIGTVDALAADAQRQGWQGRVNFVIDAQRNEFYFAQFEITRDKIRVVLPLKLASIEEVKGHSGGGEIVAGPEADKWFEGGRVLVPNAAALGRLAAGRTDFLPGEKLEPVYLRETTFVKAPVPRILPRN